MELEHAFIVLQANALSVVAFAVCFFAPVKLLCEFESQVLGTCDFLQSVVLERVTGWERDLSIGDGQ